jgi:hypothetical protein
VYAVPHECFIKIEKDFLNQLMEKDFGVITFVVEWGVFNGMQICKVPCECRVLAILLISN